MEKLSDKFIQDTHMKLNKAISNNNIEITKKILNKYSNILDINYNNNIYLHSACNNNNISLVTLLLEYGANIKHIDINGNTILHHICKSQKDYSKLFDLLLQNGRDININIKNNMNISIGDLIFSNLKQKIDMLDNLIKYNFIFTDNHLDTLFSTKKITIHENILQYMINSGLKLTNRHLELYIAHHTVRIKILKFFDSIIKNHHFTIYLKRDNLLKKQILQYFITKFKLNNDHLTSYLIHHNRIIIGVLKLFQSVVTHYHVIQYINNSYFNIEILEFLISNLKNNTIDLQSRSQPDYLTIYLKYHKILPQNVLEYFQNIGNKFSSNHLMFYFSSCQINLNVLNYIKQSKSIIFLYEHLLIYLRRFTGSGTSYNSKILNLFSPTEIYPVFTELDKYLKAYLKYSPYHSIEVLIFFKKFNVNITQEHLDLYITKPKFNISIRILQFMKNNDIDLSKINTDDILNHINRVYSTPYFNHYKIIDLYTYLCNNGCTFNVDSIIYSNDLETCIICYESQIELYCCRICKNKHCVTCNNRISNYKCPMCRTIFSKLYRHNDKLCFKSDYDSDYDDESTIENEPNEYYSNDIESDIEFDNDFDNDSP
jgi:hypothetical protein